MNTIKSVLFLLLLLFCLNINAQQNNKTIIHILHASQNISDEFLGKDVERLVGSVKMRHDSTIFFSDSAHFNSKKQLFDGFGNVHIDVNDSIDIFCELCNYNGETKIAELFNRVVLKDDSTVLRTNYMTYDRTAHLASYPNNGTITRNDKILVSKRGYYRDDIKTAYFRTNVVVSTPKYQMFTDTLVYDIEKEKMTFFGPTKIINGDNVLVGNYGWYDGIIDVAFLDNGATLSNKEYSIRSDSMFYDRTTEFAKAMSRVKIQDTVNKAIIEGDYAEMWKNKGKTLVTDSVRALYYGDKDTLFLHSDTLFFYMDTASNKAERIIAYYNVRFFRTDIQGKCDSLYYSFSDSTAKMRMSPVIWADQSQLSGDSINIVVTNNAIDSVLLYPNGFIIQKDSISGFNQIKGKVVTAYFNDNQLNHVFDSGNAETIYWLREEDGSMIGVNFSKSVSMDIKIKDNQIVRIKYNNNTSETLYPVEMVTPEMEYLKGFDWKESSRPKDKYDIFRKEVKPVENENVRDVRKKIK